MNPPCKQGRWRWADGNACLAAGGGPGGSPAPLWLRRTCREGSRLQMCIQ